MRRIGWLASMALLAALFGGGAVEAADDSFADPERRITFLSPTFPDPDSVAADYARIVARGIFSNSGPMEREFATELGRWIGTDVAVSVVSSATIGLQLAMQATFQSDRKFIVVPSFTFAAAPLAIQWCGFEPVFIDVDPVTWQASLADGGAFLESCHSQTAGILLTTTFGIANEEIGSWERLAEHYGIPLVVDAASGFGSEYRDGVPVGGRGTCEVFSFHATKTLSIGEGGAVASRDGALIETIDRLKNFGFDPSRRATMLGTNAKLPELAAAIGLRQLAELDKRLALRRQVLSWYVEGLAPLDVAFPPGVQRSALAFVPALLPSAAHRRALSVRLAAAGVEHRFYYNPPLHRHPLFEERRRVRRLRVTEELCGRVISLPMADDLAMQDVDRVVAAARAG